MDRPAFLWFKTLSANGTLWDPWSRVGMMGCRGSAAFTGIQTSVEQEKEAEDKGESHTALFVKQIRMMPHNLVCVEVIMHLLMCWVRSGGLMLDRSFWQSWQKNNPASSTFPAARASRSISCWSWRARASSPLTSSVGKHAHTLLAKITYIDHVKKCQAIKTNSVLQFKPFFFLIVSILVESQSISHVLHHMPQFLQ